MGKSLTTWVLCVAAVLLVAAAPGLAGNAVFGRRGVARDGGRRAAERPRIGEVFAEAGQWDVDEDEQEEELPKDTGLPKRYKTTADQLELDEEVQKKIEDVLRGEEQTEFREKRKALREEVRETGQAVLAAGADRKTRRARMEQAEASRKQLKELVRDNYIETQKKVMKCMPPVKSKEWPAAFLATGALDAYEGKLTDEQTKSVYALASKRASKVMRAKTYQELQQMRRDLVQHIYNEVLTAPQKDELTRAERLAYERGMAPSRKLGRRDRDNEKAAEGKRDRDGEKAAEGKRDGDGGKAAEGKRDRDGKKAAEGKRDGDGEKAAEGKRDGDGEKAAEGDGGDADGESAEGAGGW